jgi:hypothetical protein
MKHVYELSQFGWHPKQRVLIGSHRSLLGVVPHHGTHGLVIQGKHHSIEFMYAGHDDGRLRLHGELFTPVNPPPSALDIQLWYYPLHWEVPSVKQLWGKP